MKRTQAEGQELKPGPFADLVPQSSPLRFESSLYFGSLGVSAAFEQESRPPPALQYNGSESRKLSLDALLRSAIILEEHQANLFISAEDVTFLRELV